MRSSGILMHISSLPNNYQIGTFGKEAYDFIDFLKESGQKFWQVLPLGPTSYGDSPYQTFSAFAGNPYFINFDLLKEEGLLKKKDYLDLKESEIKDVNYEFVYNTSFNVLRIAFKNFLKKKDKSLFTKFINENKDWLEQYSLFMAIKSIDPKKSWLEWEDKYKFKDKEAIKNFSKDNDEIIFWKFVQFKFFSQWKNLKEYANKNKIEIIGDMPIYVALDSSDCWASPEYFQLDNELKPEAVAGVPPDAFSKTGQLWGNPLYRYEVMEKDNYSWWIKRIKKSLELFDIVRIDHFRGFEAYYSIAAHEVNAINGKWIKGPGYSLFEKVKEELGDVRIIAEDLGFLTEDVYELLKKCGFPGMKVLEFGFDPNSDSLHAPHNISYNNVVYPGTHDNKTLVSWVNGLSSEELDYVIKYLNLKNKNSINEAIIKEALKSPAKYAVVSMQDYLALDDSARFNKPATLGNNWVWRYKKKTYSKSLSKKIKNLTKIYRRI